MVLSPPSFHFFSLSPLSSHKCIQPLFSGQDGVLKVWNLIIRRCIFTSNISSSQQRFKQEKNSAQLGILRILFQKFESSHLLFTFLFFFCWLFFGHGCFDGVIFFIFRFYHINYLILTI